MDDNTEEFTPTPLSFKKEDNWENYDTEWEKSIELKISTQGKILIGIGAGLGISLLLTGLQGKVVIDVIKVQRTLADTLNSIVTIVNGGPGNTASAKVSYSEPEKVVESPPVDDDELLDIITKMNVTQAQSPNDFFNGGTQ